MGLFDGPSWSERMLWETEEQTKAAKNAAKTAKNRARENAAANAQLIEESKKRTELAAEQARAARAREQQMQALLRAQQAAAAQQQEAARRQHEQQMLANWAMFRQTPDGQQWQALITMFDDVHAKLAGMVRSWKTVFSAAREDCASRVLFEGAKIGLFVPRDHPIYTEGKGLRMRAILSTALVTGEDQPLRKVFDNAQRDLMKRNPQWADMNAAWAKWVSETSLMEVGVDLVNDRPDKIAPFCEGGFTALGTFDKEWTASKARIMRELPPCDLDRYLEVSAVPKPLSPDTYTHPALVKWLTEATENW